MIVERIYPVTPMSKTFKSKIFDIATVSIAIIPSAQKFTSPLHGHNLMQADGMLSSSSKHKAKSIILDNIKKFIMGDSIAKKVSPITAANTAFEKTFLLS